MKIVGKDGKTYATVEECIAADEAFEESEAAKALEETNKKNELSKKKKEKADAIKAAEDALSLASAEYDRAREKARKLIEEAKVEARTIVNEAAKKFDAASDARYQAIREFNKEFGTYTVTYTGKDAVEEYNRTSKLIDSFFNFLLL